MKRHERTNSRSLAMVSLLLAATARRGEAGLTTYDVPCPAMPGDPNLTWVEMLPERSNATRADVTGTGWQYVAWLDAAASTPGVRLSSRNPLLGITAWQPSTRVDVGTPPPPPVDVASTTPLLLRGTRGQAGVGDANVYVAWVAAPPGGVVQQLWFNADNTNGSGGWPWLWHVDGAAGATPFFAGSLPVMDADNGQNVYVAYRNSMGYVSLHFNNAAGNSAAWAPETTMPASMTAFAFTASDDPRIDVDGGVVHVAYLTCGGAGCVVNVARATTGTAAFTLVPSPSGATPVPAGARLRGLVARAGEVRILWHVGSTLYFNAGTTTPTGGSWRYGAGVAVNAAGPAATTAETGDLLASDFGATEYVTYAGAVGSSPLDVTLAVSDDRGATWQLGPVTSSPTPPNSRHWPTVYAEGCRVYVAYDDYSYAHEGISLVVSTTRGQAWSRVPVQLDCDVPLVTHSELDHGSRIVGTEAHALLVPWDDQEVVPNNYYPAAQSGDTVTANPDDRTGWSNTCSVAGTCDWFNGFVTRWATFPTLPAGGIPDVLNNLSDTLPRAKAHFMALLLNVADGRHAYCHCINWEAIDTSCLPDWSIDDHPDLEGVLGFIDRVLSDPSAGDACYDAMQELTATLNDQLLSSRPSSECLLDLNAAPTCAAPCVAPVHAGATCTGVVAFDVPFTDDDALTLQQCTRDGVAGPSCTLVGGPPWTVHVDDPNAPLGTHEYEVTVQDAEGALTSCTTCVSVVDRTAPVGACGGTLTPIVAENADDPSEPCCKRVTLADWGANIAFTDNCDVLPTVEALWDTNECFGIGTHQVAVRATDDAGNVGTCLATLVVGEPNVMPECPELNQVIGDEYEVRWTKPPSCDGTCCTPLINGYAVHDGQHVRIYYGLPDRVFTDSTGMVVFQVGEVCLSTECDDNPGVAACEEPCFPPPPPPSGAVHVIPFFREDGPTGTNTPAAVLALFNPNDVDAEVQVEFYSTLGLPLRDPHLPGVVPAGGNVIVPDPFTPTPGPRERLRDILNVGSATDRQLGNVVIRTLGPAPGAGGPLTLPVTARLWNLAQGSINTTSGFVEQSQWDASEVLFDDLFVDLPSGNQTTPNFLLREFIVVTNPGEEVAEITLEFRDPLGVPFTSPHNPWPPGGGTQSIPGHGCFIFNTGALLGPSAAIVEGNAVITAHPNADGVLQRIMGVSVAFGPGDNMNDLHPLEEPREPGSTPSFGADLRSDSRK